MEEAELKDFNNVWNAGQSADQNGLAERYLTFWTAGQLFAVPILNVEQIIGMQDITSVPDYPDCMKGIINMRGEIVPVLDFRQRLGKEEAVYNDRTCIIVINSNGEERVGYIVDGVEEVLGISEEQISIPPKVERKGANKFVTGIARQRYGANEDERLILCVDPVRILMADEMKRMMN